MVDQPIVSVCLPIYNGANYMEQAIKSVLAQTFSDFEFLITDDCSTDETADIVKHFANKDSRIKYWKNERQLGLFGNYNICMSKAKGRYIKLLGHDDVLHTNMIERMVAVFENNPDVALVGCAKRWIDADGNEIAPATRIEQEMMQPFVVDTKLSGKEVILKSLQKNVNWVGEPCAVLFKHEHLDHGFDTRFLQIGDLDLDYRMLEHGQYYFISEPLCSFRKHAVAISQKNLRSLKALLDWFVLGNKYKHYLLEAEGNETIYVERLTKRLIVALVNEMYIRKDNSKELNENTLKAFFKDDSALNAFTASANRNRVAEKEYHAIAVLALLEAANRYYALKLNLSKLHDLIAEISRLRIQIDHECNLLSKEVEELREALSNVGSSLSWKLTSPLRLLKSVIGSN